eukprot:3352521-Alexandrium_andersonii.AAC.1
MRSQGSPARSKARDWSANRTGRQASRAPPCRVAMRQRHGPADPMTAVQRVGGPTGGGPWAIGPLACRWAEAARRLAPQSPPAIA